METERLTTARARPAIEWIRLNRLCRHAWPALLAIALSAAPARAEGIAWAGLDEAEQRLVTRLLASEHWPIRAFAMMRLERYAGPEVETMLRARLADESWQARCFALRTAYRMGVGLAAADLVDESDARVIRTALRCGVPVDPERLERGARTLMRSGSVDDLLLGLEIAGASENEAIRREATRRTKNLFRNVNEAGLLRISRRLARVVGLEKEPESVAAWLAWFEETQGRIELAAPGARPPRSGPPLVAAMDAETFSRLLDYLGALKERHLEVAVVMDATTSMEPMINEARAGVERLILFLADISRTMRLAFIAYRDHDNPPVWEGERFTTDIDAIRQFLFGLRITGGRDLPEAVLEGLTACGRLDWTPEATHQIVLVGDARPHEEDEYRIVGLLESFREAGIVVHAVHVPQRLDPGMSATVAPEFLEAYRRQVAEHNPLTARAFAEIARLGGGDMVTLEDSADLVPSIMHLTIEQDWWPPFDQFYDLYLDLCR